MEIVAPAGGTGTTFLKKNENSDSSKMCRNQPQFIKKETRYLRFTDC
ncbi:hypothetical protein B14911_27615 [Bacillus sp. NRRL B-14911]|nr:hypothetical protein B14911_27615 [Bacillus sp. NRRL B-14911]